MATPLICDYKLVSDQYSYEPPKTCGSGLPREILVLIFSQLSISDQCSLRLTNREFCEAVKESVHSLDLSQLVRISKLGLKGINEAFPNLNKITFSEINTYEHVKALATDRIKYFDFFYCSLITDENLFDLIQRYSFREIAFPRNIKTIQTLHSIIQKGELTKLIYWTVDNDNKSLITDKNAITDETLRLIGKHLKELNHLRITIGDGFVTPEGIEFLLKECMHIEHLFIRADTITESTLIHISKHCPQLTSLTLQSYRFVNLNKKQSDIMSKGTWTQLMQGCCLLTELNLDMPIYLIDWLPTDLMPNLKIFRFEELLIQRDLITKFFKLLPNLELLACRVDNTILSAIGASCHKLTDLRCIGIVSEIGVRAIASGCRLLKTLHIRCPNLINPPSPFMFNSTPQYLIDIADNCSHLEDLYIDNYGLKLNNYNADYGVIYLVKKLSSLRVLDLSQSNISKASLEAIRQYLPNLSTFICKSCPNITVRDIRELCAALPQLEVKTKKGRYSSKDRCCILL